jgi:hypothetical protein
MSRLPACSCIPTPSATTTGGVGGWEGAVVYAIVGVCMRCRCACDCWWAHELQCVFGRGGAWSDPGGIKPKDSVNCMPLQQIKIRSLRLAESQGPGLPELKASFSMAHSRRGCEHACGMGWPGGLSQAGIAGFRVCLGVRFGCAAGHLPGITWLTSVRSTPSTLAVSACLWGFTLPAPPSARACCSCMCFKSLEGNHAHHD